MARDFLGALNSSLQAGAMMQGIYLKGKKRVLDNELRSAEETMRGIEALKEEFGDATENWPDVANQRLTQLMNDNPEMTMNHGGNKLRANRTVPVKGGVALDVTSTHPDGSVTDGVITNNGTTEDSDTVSVVASATRDLIDPLQQKMSDMSYYARVKSQKADDYYRAQQDRRDEYDAVRALGEESNRRAAGTEAGTETKSTAESVLAPPPPVAGPQAAVPQGIGERNPTPEGTPVAPPGSVVQGIGKFTKTGQFATPGAEEIVREAAAKYGNDPELSAALSFHESDGGKVDAVSHTGAQGLMQITGGARKDYNDAHGTNYSRKDMLKGKENAEVGNWYLAQKLKEWDGDVEKALTAYNGGTQHLKDAGGDITKTRPESAAFAGKVLANISQGDTQEPSTEAEVPSTQAQDTRAGTTERTSGEPIPDTAKTLPGGRQGALLKRDRRNSQAASRKAERAEIQAVRASRTPGKNRAQQKKETVRISGEIKRIKEKYAEERNPSTLPETVEEAKEQYMVQVSDFDAQTPEQQEFKEKLEADAEKPAPTQAEAESAAKAVKEKKPGQLWSDKELDAISTLARVGAIDAGAAIKLFGVERGKQRLTKADLLSVNGGKALLNLATGKFIQVPQAAQTPREKRLDEIEMEKKELELSEAKREANTDINKGGVDRLVKGLEDEYTDDGVVDLGKKADVFDKAVPTINALGLNPDAPETQKNMRAAQPTQDLYNEENGPGWLPWNWFQDTPYQNDYTLGYTINNAAATGDYNIQSPKEGERIDAITYVQDTYLKPLKGAGLSPTKVVQGTMVSSNLVKRGAGALTPEVANVVTARFYNKPKNKNATPAEAEAYLYGVLKGNLSKKYGR